MPDLIAAFAEIPLDDIPGHERTGIADMRIIIRCDPADIHADLARLQGFKFFLLLRKCVIDL
jgi:hypothetical protein